MRPWRDAAAVVNAANAGLPACPRCAMLIDLRRRPAYQVRGPKWLWASTALVNTAGIAPLSYFIVGRSGAHR